MSAFLPLNLVDDASSKKELEEDYTREIEIENAFKTFQEAITLKKSGNYIESYLKLKELSRKDVILTHYYEETAFTKGLQNGGVNTQTDELSFISPNVKSIRFLYFRTRGFLYFQILEKGTEMVKDVLNADNIFSGASTPPMTEFEFTKELFYSMMDDLANCLIYQEADEQLLRLLYDLYVYMDIKKLARFTLEYARTLSEESDDIMSILPLDDWANSLWEKFLKDGLTEKSVPESLSKHLSFLQPIKNDLKELIKRKFKQKTLQIPIKDSSTWLDVFQSFNSSLKASQDKERVQEASRCGLKHLNLYLLTESTIDRIMFTFPGNDEVVAVPDEGKVENAEKPDEEITEEHQDAMEVVRPEEEDTNSAPTALPVPFRSSRRLKPEDAPQYEPDDIQLTRHYYVETELFFRTLNDYLGRIFAREEPTLRDVVSYIIDLDVDERPGPQYIQDFVAALNDWDRKIYTPIVIVDKSSQTSNSSSKSDGEKDKLMDVLIQFGNQFTFDTSITAEDLDVDDSLELIKEFLSQDTFTHQNVDMAKIAILYNLMGRTNNKMIKFHWSDSTYSIAKDWVLQLESTIISSWDHEGFTSEKAAEILEFAITIYELLINSYIEIKCAIDHTLQSGSKGPKTKTGLNANALELLRLDARIAKWSAFFLERIFVLCPISSFEQSNISIVVRYFWASNYRLASKSFSWKEKKHVVEDLQDLSDFLKAHSKSPPAFELPNFSKLGPFSKESLHRRLSTTSILSIFSKILYNDNHKNLSGNGDTIDLLEDILVRSGEANESMDTSQSDVNMLVESVIHGKAALDKDSLRSVQAFLDECPIDLKLSLWNILLLYYEEIGNYQKFQGGFEQNLLFSLEYWNSIRYREINGNRVISFLKSLSIYAGYLRSFLKYLSENKWELPVNDCTDHFEVIHDLCRVFEICYVFSLHEEAALITGNKVSLGYRSEAAFKSFKDLFIDSVTIIMVYCVSAIRNKFPDESENMITELLRTIHQQLGLRHLCDASSGLFLRFSEFTLVSFKDKPNSELAQLLSCRFHIRMKTYDQYPVDHYTTKFSELDRSSATDLAAFVLPLCFKENPIIKAPRNDMKQILDDLMEVIGDPDIEGNSSLMQNNAALEKFIDTSVLTTRFIKDCFYGLTSIDLVKPKIDSRVARNGLYFLQAITMFNSYKIRKKSAQSRIVELERIIRLLLNDLMFQSDRVESWLLLGQAYGYIVEDDLIWTSDKLNIIDRKVVTANLQRKSLVCYIMAINTFTRKGPNVCGIALIGLLMNSFVKELYSAARVPMDMIAFKVRNTYKFVRKKNQTLFQTVSDKPTVSMKFCLKLILRCCDLAVKSDPSEWSSFYYMGKAMDKLNMDPIGILDTMIKSCQLCQIQGTSTDPILEASYKVISLLYKYVKADRISLETAANYLNKEPILNLKIDQPVTLKQEFYKIVISALEKVLSLDKKAWYHKPCYRIAVISYDEFDDHKKARDIMNKFFSLKVSNKTFLQMWKPDNERPGKHFVYMFQYTQFFIKVLRRELDLSSLIQILPKLRKANSTMVLLNYAWENVCASICKLIRVISQVEENFVEVFLLQNSHNLFITQATIVVDNIKEKGIREDLKPLFCYLHVINDMRKLNNGFGPTSLIDDTICAVFLKIFNGIMESNPMPASSDIPVTRFKKLAKRDLFPFINDLVTKCKREVDSYIKENPDIFNTYVAEYIDFKRNLSMQMLSQTPLSIQEQIQQTQRVQDLGQIQQIHQIPGQQVQNVLGGLMQQVPSQLQIQQQQNQLFHIQQVQGLQIQPLQHTQEFQPMKKKPGQLVQMQQTQQHPLYPANMAKGQGTTAPVPQKNSLNVIPANGESVIEMVPNSALTTVFDEAKSLPLTTDAPGTTSAVSHDQKFMRSDQLDEMATAEDRSVRLNISGTLNNNGMNFNDLNGSASETTAGYTRTPIILKSASISAPSEDDTSATTEVSNTLGLETPMSQLIPVNVQSTSNLDTMITIESTTGTPENVPVITEMVDVEVSNNDNNSVGSHFDGTGIMGSTEQQMTRSGDIEVVADMKDLEVPNAELSEPNKIELVVQPENQLIDAFHQLVTVNENTEQQDSKEKINEARVSDGSGEETAEVNTATETEASEEVKADSDEVVEVFEDATEAVEGITVVTDEGIGAIDGDRAPAKRTRTRKRKFEDDTPSNSRRTRSRPD